MACQISELAVLISPNSQKVVEYLAASKLPPPSFDEDSPVRLNLSVEAEDARSAVINATAGLQALLQGPDQLLRPIVSLLPILGHASLPT